MSSRLSGCFARPGGAPLRLTLAAIVAMPSVVTMALAITMASIAFGSASAQTRVTAGTLTCTGGAGVGLILGSQKTYQCEFASPNGTRGGEYRGVVTRIGLDLGVTGNAVMVWTVLSATGSVGPRDLAGGYVGASADVAVGIGGGAKALVGGSGNSIVLQPLSVQGQTGLNLAVGVAELRLE
jgi:hypothetical protein